MSVRKTEKIRRKLTKKVPKVEPKVKVIHLRCPNCGEEDEKVIYCSQCDSPMEVVKVEVRGEDEVVIDAAISKDQAGEEPEDEVITKASSAVGANILADSSVDASIESGGFSLDNIYSDGEEIGSVGDVSEDQDIDKIMDSIDEG